MADTRSQFNLLHGSLSKELRPDLKAAIVDGTYTPAKIALLTSENLATAEQLAEIQAARAENLRQHVKIKEKEKAIRFGRDGFEEVETADDKMDRELHHEKAEQRRESGVEAPVPAPVVASRSPSEPVVVESPVRRRSSISVSGSPAVQRPSVSLSSAWGDKTAPQEEEEMDVEEDQDVIDLSDIVHEDIDYGDGLDYTKVRDEWKEFLTKPVGWNGEVSWWWEPLTTDHKPSSRVTAYPACAVAPNLWQNSTARFVLEPSPPAADYCDCWACPNSHQSAVPL